MKKTFADIVKESAADDMKRLISKLPEWEEFHDRLVIPSRLSTEQCSSSETAAYKAALAKKILTLGNSGKIADLSGGLGVDSWAFARSGFHVLYNEMLGSISKAAEHNFGLLGVPDIIVKNYELTRDSLPDILGDFRPNLIYLDPARRGKSGEKVFKLEDCSPNILELKDLLLDYCPHILLKLSPMADISQVCRSLGNNVREVHISGSDNECKELLVWMDKGWNGLYELICGSIRFKIADETESRIILANSTTDIENGYIFEPSATIMKAGCFRLLCEKFDLIKIGVSTHLYHSNDPNENLKQLGKVFEIDKVLPFGSKTISALAKEYPRCEVTARNLPISSNELRTRMKNTSGGESHLFACRADFATGISTRLIFVTHRI